MPFTNDTEQFRALCEQIIADQYTEDRPDVPDQCPICKGTGEIRHDWINKTEKVINGYRLLSGVNMVTTPCDCMDSDAAARQIVQPVQITVEYAPPPPSVIYGECRGCKAEGEIGSDGYCFEC